MSIEANKAMVRLNCDEMFNQGYPPVADEMFAANYVEHFPGMPSRLVGFKHFLVMLRATFPDLHVTLEDLIGEGDQVMWRWTMQGTQQGELFRLPIWLLDISVLKRALLLALPVLFLCYLLIR